jgi:hypothetical protein
MYEPTNALNKIQFMTSIELLHVSAPGRHPKGVIEGIEIQRANLDNDLP